MKYDYLKEFLFLIAYPNKLRRLDVNSLALYPEPANPLNPFCAGVLKKLESGKQVDLKNYCLIPPGSLQVDVSFDAYEVRMYSRLEKC